MEEEEHWCSGSRWSSALL